MRHATENTGLVSQEGGDLEDAVAISSDRPSPSPAATIAGAFRSPRARTVAASVTAALALTGLVLYSSSPKWNVAPSLSQLSSHANDLSFVVHRAGYEALEGRTRDAYGFEHILEPNADMNFKVTNGNDGSEYEYKWTITHLRTGTVHEVGDGEVLRTDGDFTGTNEWYSIEVLEYKDGETTGRRGYSTKAITRYVRREIRKVREGDLERYLEAVHTVFTTGWEEGRELYGLDFHPHSYFADLHCSTTYSFHGNVLFTTSHPAMLIMFERSVMAVDSGVVMPYFDFMLNSASDSWTDIFIFDEDMFGTVKNGPEVDFRPQGRFHDVKMVTYNQGSNAENNVYGYLTDSYSKNDYIQRSNYYCGYYATEGFSGCDKLKSCFDAWLEGSTFDEFDTCMEKKSHGVLHAMFGGMWSCEVDLAAFKEEHESWLSDRLLSFLANNFVDMYIAKSQSGSSSSFYCAPESCSTKTDTFESCRVKACDIDSVEEMDAMSLERVYHHIKQVLASWHLREYDALKFLNLDDSATTFKYTFKGLDATQNGIIYRMLLKIMAFPGQWGQFNSCAASNDPIFWSIHQVFDRALHAARLSAMADEFDYTWTSVTDDSQGVGWLDKTPFYSDVFKLDDGAQLDNKHLFKYLHPQSMVLEYVYDHVFDFGYCNFDEIKS